MVLLLSGLARAYLLSGEGREVTLFRIAEGGGCVLSASCVISEINFDTFLGAERDTRLLIIPSGVFARLAERNLRVKLWMYEQAARPLFRRRLVDAEPALQPLRPPPRGFPARGNTPARARACCA